MTPSSRSSSTGSDPALQTLARLLRTLADTNRLQLLEQLGAGELTVTQLAEAVGRPFQPTSSHLRALWSERLVTRRRAGSHVLYRRTRQAGGALVEQLLTWARAAARER